MASRMNDDWYRKAAKAKFEDEGTIEFDDEPETSANDDPSTSNGCYVRAWVWVYDPDPEKMPDIDKTLFRNPKITDDEINQLIEEYS